MNLARGLAWGGVGLLTCAVTMTQAAEPTPAAVNAGSVYLRAAAMLPDLTADEELLLRELTPGGPRQTEVNQLRRKCQTALQELEEGSRLAECDFGANTPAAGPEASSPHLVDVRRLLWVATWDARHALAEQQYGAGRERALAVLRMGRHVSQVAGAGYATVLTGYTIEQRVIELLAEFAPRLPPDTRRAILAGLDAAPRRQPMIAALRAEREATTRWMRECLAQNPDVWESIVLGLINGEPAEVAQRLRSRPLTRQRLAAQVDAFDAACAQLIAAMAAPWPRREAAVRQAEVEALESVRPLGVFLQPALSMVQFEALIEIHERMLRAGLAHLDANAAAFAEQVDPVTGQPFELRTRDDGFELHTTTIGIDDRPIALGFGVLLRPEKD